MTHYVVKGASMGKTEESVMDRASASESEDPRDAYIRTRLRAVEQELADRRREHPVLYVIVTPLVWLLIARDYFVDRATLMHLRFLGRKVRKAYERRERVVKESERALKRLNTATKRANKRWRDR